MGRDEDRTVESYRAHELVAGKGGGGYQGIVWKGGKKLHANVGDSLENVLRSLRQHVDAILDQTAKTRIAPPTGDEYVSAFQKILRNLSDAHCAMLQAHYCAPDQPITATKLAAAAGYSKYSAANLQYGNMGKALYEELPVELRRRADGTPIYTSAPQHQARRLVLTSTGLGSFDLRWLAPSSASA